MSLNTAQLKSDLMKVYTDTYETTGNRDEALEAFIGAMCDKLETYVKSAQIIYDNGLTAGSNPVIGTFNGRLE